MDYYLWAVEFMPKQVMLACGKYNLVYEFFRKVQKSHIPNALAYKGMLVIWPVSDAVFYNFI